MEFFQITWYILWSVLWMVYFALDGFDLGSAIAMPFVAKNENEKKAIVTSFGPFWDGNEVWLITAGGATFAAFPVAYANMFSWFYIPLFLVLLSLISRGVSVELRNKVENKKLFDFIIFTSSFIATFLFGVFFGNLWTGVEVSEAGYTEGLFGLLTPGGILSGVMFVFFFLMHGLLWLLNKIEGELKLKIYKLSKNIWYLTIIFLGIFIVFLPLSKNPNYTLSSTSGKLSVLFYAFSALIFMSIKKFLNKGKEYSAFLSSFTSIIFFVAAGFSGNYPNLIPAKNPSFNTTIFNSSSSLYTLKLMTIVAVIFVPVVIAYQIWVYKVLHAKITPEKNQENY